MNFSFSDLWDWRGTTVRGKYLTIGLLLFALKHNLDRFVAAAYFNRRWSIFNYWVFPEASNVEYAPLDYKKFYATLLLIARPFIWTGVYWNRWSDYIIGRIHARVPDHIKNLAEK